jgi:cyclopropane-fatty-acyl-phospholipid synthase
MSAPPWPGIGAYHQPHTTDTEQCLDGKRIFPGSYAPCLSELADIFEPHDISVLDVENLRLHYRDTCLARLERFQSVAPAVSRTYGEVFVRAWRLYLAGSAASFNVGNLQLYQVLFSPTGNNDVPWTRHYQYAPKFAGAS